MLVTCEECGTSADAFWSGDVPRQFRLSVKVFEDRCTAMDRESREPGAFECPHLLRAIEIAAAPSRPPK